MVNPIHSLEGGPMNAVQFERVCYDQRTGEPIAKDGKIQTQASLYPGATVWDMYFASALSGVAIEAHNQIEEFLEVEETEENNERISASLNRAVMVAAMLADTAVDWKRNRAIARAELARKQRAEQENTNGQHKPRIVMPEDDE